jgi:hypothetical protein
MKKLLVAVLALTTMSAFAGNSMIKLDGCFDGTCDTLDFNMAGDDTDAADASMNLAFNYAMAFGGNYGAGLTFAKSSQTTDGDMVVGNESDNAQTIGLSFYWNKDGSWDDSCFAAFHYNMVSWADADVTAGGADSEDTGAEATQMVVEFGHRYKLGSLMGLNWNWTPSVSYAMTAATSNVEDADTVNSTELTINVANMAVTF